MTRKGNPKILHLIDSEGVYGAERVILNLSEEMIRSGNYHPVVGCIVDSPDSVNALYEAAIGSGIDAIKIPIRNSKLTRDLPHLISVLKQEGINLVHSHGYKPSVFSFVIKPFSNVDVIATCHLWFSPETGPLKMRLMVSLEKMFYRWFTLVVAVSEPIKKVLLDNGVDKKCIHVVENGVSTEAKGRSDRSLKIRQSLGVTKDQKLLVNIGRLTKQKAQSDLLKSAVLLKSKNIDFHMLIVGEGPLKKSLSEKIERLKLTDKVTLVGYRNDIPDILAASDIFLLPSLDEGMPMALLEAVAEEIPVITTPVGDIPKLIEDCVSGMLVSINSPEEICNAVERLLSDSSMGRQMSRSAKDRMKRYYSNVVMASKYEDIYSKIFRSFEKVSEV